MSNGSSMNAHVLHAAGDLRFERVSRPEPGPGEVLVGVRAAGICGSDLHYHAHGRCGNFVPTRPFILGHEFAGEVVALGHGVESLAVGARVAVDPSRACGRCKQCRQGRYNLCPHMQYYGTASVVPPNDGCFAEFVTAPARNCWPLPDDFEYSWGALLEPMSVAMHAVSRAGSTAGKSVLITGGGAIGQMILLVAIAFGGTRVVVSDLKPFAREFALKHGATAALDPADARMMEQARTLCPEGFEIVFEATGVPAALDQGIRLTAPGATVVQVGTLPDGIPFPANALLTRELQYLGSWRFANVFDRAIDLISSGRIDPRPLVTHVFPFPSLAEAIALAGSGGEVVKVQIANPT